MDRASLPSTRTGRHRRCRSYSGNFSPGCASRSRSRLHVERTFPWLHAWKVLPRTPPLRTTTASPPRPFSHRDRPYPRPPPTIAPGILVRILNLTEWRRCNESTNATTRATSSSTSYPRSAGAPLLNKIIRHRVDAWRRKSNA